MITKEQLIEAAVAADLVWLAKDTNEVHHTGDEWTDHTPDFEAMAKHLNQVLATYKKPIHITVLTDWLAARYRAAGGKEGITDVSAWAEEVMRWTEEHHGIGGEVDPLFMSTLEEAESNFHQLALDYRGAVSVSVQEITWHRLWAHVKALHEELALLRARALAVEAAQEAVGPDPAAIDWEALAREVHDGIAQQTGFPFKTLTARKPEEWERPARLLSGVSDGIHPIPVTPRGGLDLQLRRWCSPCQEYATTRCVGDRHECPLKFPKEG